MSKKKVTAPTTYNPGSGHPKEYLAYLNWQEMQALQRLNGNGPRRGPKGIPSFADDSASSMGVSRPDTGGGNWTGAPGGTTTGTTTADGGDYTATGSDVGSVQSSSDVGGIQSSVSSPAATAPTAPAGGQNPVDAAVQQAAAYKDAVVASRQQALSQDIANGGISAINVGPMNVPVKIGGGQIAGTINKIATGSYGLATPDTSQDLGGGLASLPPSGQSALPASPVQSAAGAEELARRDFVSRQLGVLAKDEAIKSSLRNAIGQSMWETRIKDATRFAQRKSPLGAFGEVGPASDIAGFRTIQEQAGISPKYTKIKDPTRGYHTWGMAVDVVPERLPRETQRQYDNRVGEVNREIAKNITDPAVEWGGEWKFVDPAHFQYGTGSVFSSVDKYGSNVRTAGVRPTGFPEPEVSVAFSQPPVTVTPTQIDVTPASTEIAAVEDVYRTGIYPSGSIVGPGQFGYPTKPDGTPVTAEDLAAMPEDVQREYMDKMRFARMTDEKYPLTTDQKIKVAAVTGITAPVTGNIFAKVGTTVIGGISGLLGKLPGQFGDAFSEVQRGMRTLAKPGQAVAAYERLDPLKQQQLATGYGVPSETPSGTSGNAGVAGIPTQELGGKNYQYQTAYYQPYQGSQTEPVERRRRRISQYERWDRGIGIPSPGDPNYNEYQEYLAAGGSDRYT